MARVPIDLSSFASPERSRLSILVEAFERDLSDYIDSNLLVNHSPQQILSLEDFERASFRRDKEGREEELSLAWYLDLPDKFHVIMRNREKFPVEERPSFPVLGEAVVKLYPPRNRLTHSRPLLPRDPQNGMEAAAAIVGTPLPFERVRQTLQILLADPFFVPEGSLNEEEVATTRHNIPPGDFDSTGLIGREDERNKLHSLLIDPRSPVVSVVAPGGVGKTALALQVLHDLKDDPRSPFEMIAYVSLQTERLTVNGIQAIADAVSSLDEALPRLTESLPNQNPESIAALGEALDGMSCLIVIDNLETITASEVIDFIDTMPSSIQYLFTSRVGIGQLERRLDLGSLGLPQAVHLIRGLGAACRLAHFEHGAQGDLETVASKLGCVPLSIKMAIKTCETGVGIDIVLANTDVLDEFCVARLFESLTDDADAAAWALWTLDRPVPDSLLLLCLETEFDESRAAIHELLRHMFIIHSESDRITQVAIELSPGLRSHMGRLHDRGQANADVVSHTLEVDKTTRAEVRRIDAERERGWSGPNIIRGGPEHNAARALLRKALTLTRHNRDFHGAYELIDQAQAIDPSFWEVYRVRAFLLTQEGRAEAATRNYETALELAPPNETAHVKHQFAGHLSRTSEGQERGLQFAREAAEELGTPESQFGLGVALQRAGELDEAIDVLREILESEAPMRRATKHKVASALLNTYRRKIDHILETTQDIDEELAVLEEALQLASNQALQSLRSQDDRTVNEIANLISQFLAFCSAVDDASKLTDLLTLALNVFSTIRLLEGAGDQSKYVAAHAGTLIMQNPELEPLVAPFIELSESAGSIRHSGYISAFDRQKGGGFISAEFPERVRCFEQYLIDQAQVDLLTPGAKVEFEITYFAAYGKTPIARDIAVKSPAEELGPLRDRTLLVVMRATNFAFLKDSETHIAAFLYSADLEQSIAWEEVQEGTQWKGDLTIGERHAFQVVELRRLNGDLPANPS